MKQYKVLDPVACGFNRSTTGMLVNDAILKDKGLKAEVLIKAGSLEVYEPKSAPEAPVAPEK